MKVPGLLAATVSLLFLVYLVVAAFLPEYMIAGFRVHKFWGR